MDETRRLAADLGRFLEEVRAEGDVAEGAAADARGWVTRRNRLERYVAGMSRTQRLRLAAALHLLSGRLDRDLAHPDFRAPESAAS